MTTPAWSIRCGVLHYWALATLACTFFLLCSGGIVTSKGVGMSVPDWPTTYGYNMFLFPISGWVGGIFYEHGHRLIASGVGLMTMILAALLLAWEPRRWVRHLGVVSFLAVCVQGLLGGLRVSLFKDEIGIFHATLAQSFFCLLAILAVATSQRFISGHWDVFVPSPSLRKWVFAVTGLVFLQLVLGATMRHEHAGLAIPDFPTAYGKWWPDTSESALATINKDRLADDKVPTSATQIMVQMAHRIGAVVLLATAIGLFLAARRAPAHRSTVIWSSVLVGLILAQATLGAWTIWSNKAADVATTHMALGALTLLYCVVFSFRICRGLQTTRFTSPDPAMSRDLAARCA